MGDPTASARRLRSRIFAGALSVTALGALGMADNVRAGEGVNTGYFGKVAIKGYDPVAYFTEGRAVMGSEQHVFRWLGATWRFANRAHRELFARSPIKYAPQYGGHCADGVSLGTITTNIDPTAFQIIDDKLYLNYDPGAAKGLADNPEKIVNADHHWPEVRATLVAHRR